MSTSNAKLGDDFLRVPKLVVDGENWMTYKDRLSWSVDACGFLGHLEGTEKKPIDPSTLSGRGASWIPSTSDELRELSAYRSGIKEWQMGEAITKQQIAGTIPDSLFIQVKNLATAAEIFAYLSNLFEKRSRVVSVELLRKLQDLKCPEKGNLSSLGHAPTDESFTAIIMSSLPASYDPHLSALTASTKVRSVLLTADVLMSTVVDEYDRRALKTKKNGSSNDDAAYNANAGEKSDGKGKDKKSETAASTKDKDDEEPEGVWLMDDTDDAGEEQTSFTYATLAISKPQRES
ncbi:hypothetical protein DFH29DRAFT_1002666 [Suillus ampliporus]|nr:hypothetical protein DFH29DRAFT_1002666 [Suillus ampliporus]